MDNELMLFDRIEVIKTTIKKYGEDNFYLSFSGGKDSTILHYLLDEALPNNKIPRVYIDTGIEYLAIREFVMNLAKSDERIKIIKPTRPIVPTLQKYGYPFKSKEFAKIVGSYQLQKDNIKKYLDMDKGELERYMLNHKEEEKALVGEGVFVLYYIKGIRGKRDKDGYITSFEDSIKYSCPKSLLYLFGDEYKVKTSNLCCTKLKKEPVHKWEKANGKSVAITGMRRSEGGQRANIKGCIITDDSGKAVKFHPLLVVSDEWEEWYLKERGIKLCPLYYPPFNFKRTGCKGCPFALDLQEQLSTMSLYLPKEREQCEFIWKPVYDEYRRVGYRLEKWEQLKLF